MRILEELGKKEKSLLEYMKKEVLKSGIDYIGFEVAIKIFEKNGKDVNDYKQFIDRKNMEKVYNHEKRLGIVRNVFMR